MHFKLLFIITIPLILSGCSTDDNIYWGVHRDYPRYFDGAKTVLRIPSTKVKGDYDFFRSFPIQFKLKEEERVLIDEGTIENFLEKNILCCFVEYYQLKGILGDTVIIGNHNSTSDFVIPENDDSPRWGQAIFAKKKHAIAIRFSGKKVEQHSESFRNKYLINVDSDSYYYNVYVSYVMNNDYSRFGNKYVYLWALQDENHSIYSLSFSVLLKKDDTSEKWFLDQILIQKQFEDFTPYENFKNFEEFGWNQFVDAMHGKNKEWNDLMLKLLNGKLEIETAVKDSSLPILPVSDYRVLPDHE